ncbi:hypothetical protein Ddc_09711 [Ditylenchus destructor]|nr:hypothetical protein Ddc_09711 [Ditylenchus destructor]
MYHSRVSSCYFAVTSWNPLFLPVICILFSLYIRPFNCDLGNELSFPTRVFSAQRSSLDNAEKQNFNIGVIQVRLKNWTTKSPNPSNLDEFYADEAGEGPHAAAHRKRTPSDETNPSSSYQSMALDQNNTIASSPKSARRRKTSKKANRGDESDADNATLEYLWGQLEQLNSSLGYMIIAISFALVALLAIFYAILTSLLSRRSRKKHELELMLATGGLPLFDQQSQHLIYPHSHRHYRGLPDELYDDEADDFSQAPTELERLYRSIGSHHHRRGPPSMMSDESSVRKHHLRKERRRPPLEAPPPPPPPQVPPPPIPPHFVRRAQQNKRSRMPDSRVEREIRNLHNTPVKRQMSDSTNSTRTRTASF